MSNLSINSFNFGVKPIRVALVNGETHWVAKDVAEALGYAWKGASGSISHVPVEWRGVCSVQTPSGDQDMITLSEQGLYFFLGRSDKPAALPMQKWVAGEVLPSIRKTGAYSIAPTIKVPQTLAEALRMAADQAEQIEALGCKVQNQAEDIHVLEPKAAAADAITRSEDTMSISEAAKTVSLGLNRLFDKLRSWGWVYIVGRDNHPYQTHIDNGNLVVKVIHYEEEHTGKDRIYPKILVTGKGLIAIQKRLGAEAPASLLRPQHRA